MQIFVQAILFPRKALLTGAPLVCSTTQKALHVLMIGDSATEEIVSMFRRLQIAPIGFQCKSIYMNGTAGRFQPQDNGATKGSVVKYVQEQDGVWPQASR